MKKQFPFLCTAVACCLTALCFWQVMDLTQQLHIVEGNLASQINATRSSVDSISSNIERSLAQQASLLADSWWTYGEPNPTNRTASVTFSVTPKEVTPGVTTAELVCEGRTYPMTLENGRFSAKTDLDLFSNFQFSHVIFTENITQRIESLNWSLSPRFNFFSTLYASAGTSYSTVPSSEERSGIVRVTYVDLNNYAGSEQSVPIVSAELVELLDGQERSRMPLSLDLSKDDGINFSTFCNLAQTYRVPPGTVHELYVDAADRWGFHYRILVSHAEFDEEGRLVQSDDWSDLNEEADIYDNDGNLLFRCQPPE